MKALPIILEPKSRSFLDLGINYTGEVRTSLHLLFTSFANKEEALLTLRTLLKERLIACGTLLPSAYSLYVWKDQLEETAEVVVFLKTSTPLLNQCMERLKELHPYEVPEIIALEAAALDSDYGNWLKQVLSGSNFSSFAT